MQTHILFENFRVREGIFWADSNSGQCEIWFKQNPHCASHPHVGRYDPCCEHGVASRVALPQHCWPPAAIGPRAPCDARAFLPSLATALGIESL
jgi:hypothetical protein